MADTTNVHAEDVFPVRSRVSWGAIFAGAFVALALTVLLNLLGGAIGLSIADWTNADPERANAILWGVGIWATISSLIALFVGGWVTSQVTAGENKFEAAIYGVVLWGVLFAMLFGLGAMGLRLGLTAFLAMGTNNVGLNQVTAADVDRAARAAGLNEEQTTKLRESFRVTPEDFGRETDKVPLEARGWSDHFPVTVRLTVQGR